MKALHTFISIALLLTSLLLFNSCKKEEPAPDDENELITTVRLKFTESGTTTVQTFEWKDLDGDGGAAPILQAISLKANKTYTLAVSFLDESKMPFEDITEEIKKEADEHLVVFTAMPMALFTYTATDKDSRNLPIELMGSVKTAGANTGTMRVQLRHQPSVGGKALKDGTAAPGSDDINIVFNMTVSQ